MAIACWRWGKVATSTHSPPVRRRSNRGTSYLRAKCRLRRLRSETRLRAQRSALRLFFAPRFARLRGDSLLVVGKVATSTHSPPVRRRVNRGTSYLRAKCRLRRLRSETRLRAQRSALRLFFAPRFARLRGDSLLVVGKVATSTHSPPVRRRVNRGTSSLCAPAVFAPRFARLRGDSRAGKKITFPQKRKSQKEAPDTAWGRNTAPWVLSQQDKPSRMDTMAQFTLSHMILIIVPCRDNGVNTTRNVAPRRIFCIFVSTFGQYVKRPGSGSRRTQNSAAPDPAHDPILLIFSNLLVDVFI